MSGHTLLAPIIDKIGIFQFQNCMTLCICVYLSTHTRLNMFHCDFTELTERIFKMLYTVNSTISVKNSIDKKN